MLPRTQTHLIHGRSLTRSRKHRRESTDAEKRLWYALRDRALGAKFRRQLVIGDYIVDFCCSEHKLIIELDGVQHADQQHLYDAQRTRDLQAPGYRVIRFWNEEVMNDLANVLERIRKELNGNQNSERS